VDQCTPEEEKKIKWRHFKLMIDYIRDIATNYFYMLSSLHISWFMEHV
jgi:hypothetical protein